MRGVRCVCVYWLDSWLFILHSYLISLFVRPSFPSPHITHTETHTPISSPRGLHYLCVCGVDRERETEKESESVSLVLCCSSLWHVISNFTFLNPMSGSLPPFPFFYRQCFSHIPTLLWCISSIRSIVSWGISGRIYKMSGDQNLGDKLRLYPGRTEICRWQSCGCCGMQDLLDCLGVRDKAANTRGRSSEAKKKGWGGSGKRLWELRWLGGFSFCASMHYGNWN